MPTWSHLFHRINETAKAETQEAMNNHTDPKIQVEMAVSARQNRHNQLVDAASGVLADEKVAKMRLTGLYDKKARLTASATAAKAAADAAQAKGDQAAADSSLSAARTFAMQLVQVQDEIPGQEKLVSQLEEAADHAKTAVQDSSEQLQQLVQQRSQILATVDQAKVEEQVADSMKQLNDLTGNDGDVPSLEAIQQRAQERNAKAQATIDLHSNDPAMAEMQAHHAELTASADAVLAQLSAPPAKALESTTT